MSARSEPRHEPWPTIDGGDSLSGTLLLLEDDDVDAERIDRWLGAMAEAEWRIVRVRCLADALAVLDDGEVDFAVVDLTLPDADGLEAVGAILHRAPAVPLVVQTGVDDRDTPLAALRLGAQDYLAKDTLTRDGLHRAVRHAATRHALRRTAASLAESDAELDDFAHVVAHDLRAPVRTARLLANRLLASLEAGSVAPLVGDLGSRLDDALVRVDTMILSMLDYSALRHAELTVEPVDLATAVHESVAAIQGDLAGLDVELSCDVASGIAVSANADLLHRVLINVLTNSVKYRRSSVPLTLSISGRMDGRLVRLSITDNGVGVPPSERERVFELLERLDGSSTGLGFGLAICRRALDQCGGRIWIEPQDPPGTTVTIELAVAP